MTRTPPQDLDAERSVLGAMMLSPEAASRALAMLTAEDFFSPKHAAIFGAAADLADRLDGIDETTVCGQLTEAGRLAAVGGAPYLLGLTDAVPTAANVAHYARIVKGHSRRRRLIRCGSEMAADAYDLARPVAELEDEAAAAVTGAADDRTGAGPMLGGDLAREEIADAEQRTKTRGVGLSTGLPVLDDWLGGLQPGALIVLAGRPAMGKTAMAINMAAHAVLRAGAQTLVFSYEMSGNALFRRILCSEAKLGSADVRRMQLDERQRLRYDRTVATLGSAPIAIDETRPNILGIRARARRHKQRHGLRLIVVDYLQLVTSGGTRSESRERDVAEISRGLKALAGELKVPVLLLSQLNRGVESRDNKRPRLSDLRESGAIEQDADVVGFLYRDHYYDDRADPAAAELHIAKQREGPTGRLDLRWTARYCLFEQRP